MNQYRLVKDGKYYSINAHKDKAKISLISVHQGRRIMSSTKKFVLFFLREGKARITQQVGDEGILGCIVGYVLYSLHVWTTQNLSDPTL